MAPNDQSYVTLSDTTAPVFGQQQTHINWELSDLDKKTYETATALYQKAVETHGGKVTYLMPWEQVHKQVVVNGHHLGTTRMSSDPVGQAPCWPIGFRRLNDETEVEAQAGAGQALTSSDVEDSACPDQFSQGVETTESK